MWKKGLKAQNLESQKKSKQKPVEIEKQAQYRTEGKKYRLRGIE